MRRSEWHIDPERFERKKDPDYAGEDR